MVQLCVRLPTGEGQTQEIVRALSAVMVSARIDRGCDSAGLFLEVEDPSVVLYVENWEDIEQIERRIRSERFRSLLALMEACRAAPEFEVRIVSEIRGLDYVASLRHAPLAEVAALPDGGGEGVGGIE